MRTTKDVLCALIAVLIFGGLTGCPEKEQYTLTINTDGLGTTDPWPGVHTYDSGTKVWVEAIPNTEHEFQGWEFDSDFDASPYEAKILVPMTRNRTITACFVESKAANPPVKKSILERTPPPLL